MCHQMANAPTIKKLGQASAKLPIFLKSSLRPNKVEQEIKQGKCWLVMDNESSLGGAEENTLSACHQHYPMTVLIAL